MTNGTRQAVLVDGIRTVVGKAGKSLRKRSAVQLLEHVIVSICKKTNISTQEVEQFIIGHGYVHGNGLNSARQASLRAGARQESSGQVVIQACGSSLQAIWQAVLAVNHEPELITIAGGVESMSTIPHLLNMRTSDLYGHQQLRDALIADGLECSVSHYLMGQLAEKIASKYEINRTDQDEYALHSHQKASRAEQLGHFNAERMIFPELSADESIRHDASLEKLMKLPTIFEEYGTVTPGNACPMNDAACVLLVMDEQIALDHGYQDYFRIIGQAVCGVDPIWMGLGPVPATNKALFRAGLTLQDIDWIELNEAFAAQVLGVICEWEQFVPDVESKINPLGGAIALGHPVGATGAILVNRAMQGLRRTQKQYGLITLCMAGGMGWSMIIERITR